MPKQEKFETDDKVIYIPEGKIYDFRYYSAVKGKAIISEEGEHNMQDSYAVAIKDLMKVKK